MTNKTDWVRLVYASRANFSAGKDNATLNSDVARILMQSRKNNPANGLVGALYFGDGCFFQCLEGPAEAVDGLYARLHQDSRHRDLKVLSRSSVEHASFSRWSMKFVPNAAVVRDVLAKHGLRTFDPYSFTPAMLAEMISLLLQGSDLPLSETQAVAVVPTGDDGLATARRAKMIAVAVAVAALLLSLVALGTAAFR